MGIGEIVNWFFGIVGVVGVLLTVYYENKTRKLERLNKSLSWSELQAGTHDLTKQFRGSFQPEVILSPNLRGGILSHLIMDSYDYHIPVFIGQIFWRKLEGEIPSIPDHFQIQTGKWMLYIPKSLMEFSDKKLLIVDDFAMSGDTLASVKQVLVENGFDENKIKTVSLVTTKVAIQNSKASDYFWKAAEDDDFYFPWGKAR